MGPPVPVHRSPSGCNACSAVSCLDRAIANPQAFESKTSTNVSPRNAATAAAAGHFGYGTSVLCARDVPAGVQGWRQAAGYVRSHQVHSHGVPLKQHLHWHLLQGTRSSAMAAHSVQCCSTAALPMLARICMMFACSQCCACAAHVNSLKSFDTEMPYE